MAAERIDNVSEARHLRHEYHTPHVGKVRTDHHVGHRPVHQVDGTGANGIVVDLDQLAAAERRLGELADDLRAHRNKATALTDALHDGSSPVTVAMRQAFLDRADVDNGVQGVLDDYLAEITDVRLALLNTLASYQAIDGGSAELLASSGQDLPNGGAV